MSVGYEYRDGVLMCAQHHTPVQKDKNGLWCRKCQEAAKIMDTTYDIHCKTCGHSDEVQCDEAPKFCPHCGAEGVDWCIVS
jgi:Zn finger protein HypA/HybF involved in hydrogenase expression